MKVILRILHIVIIAVIMAGCSEKNTKEDYDISIISKNKVSLFKQENGSIKLQKEIKRSEDYGFLKEDYYDLKDKMFLKTTVVGKDALLAKIDKESLNIKLKEDNSEPYTFTHYKNKIYATTVFTDKFSIIEYDENFKEVNKKDIKKEGVNITNDIQVYKDNIYILGGNIDKNNQLRNLIWKFDMSYNLVEEIDLNYSQGAYMRFYIKDDVIYLTQNSQGLTEKNEPKGSNKLLKYNLNTKNNKQKIIYFNDRPKNEDKPPFFNQDKMNYYFLFYDKLYVYDKKTLEEKVHNLSDFNITDANIIVTKTSE